nr:MAG: hypothetical protein [Caudoviricetes sp.]
MSILKTKYIQIGNDLVANNNFTIYQPAVADGTLRFAYGTADGIKTDVIRFSNTGNISITGNTIYSDLSTTGNTTIGDASGDRLTINGSTITLVNSPSFTGNTTFSSNVSFTGGVSGSALTNYLSSPAAIGSGTANTARFSTLTVTGNSSQANVTANIITANTVYAEIITNSEDIIWDSATDTYTRSNGLAATQKITNIHSKMRRCVLLDNGSVNYYLDSANSALKADGTASNLTGADGMVMVEIPKFYVKYSRTGTLNSWSIAEVPLPGYILYPAFIVDGLEVSARYYGSYDACIWTTGTTYQSGLNYDDNVGAGQNWNTASARLASVSGIYPAVGISRAEARTMAANRGTRWRQLDFHLISAIQLLYLIEYGSFYSQSKIGLGNVQVATGYPASSANQTDSPHSVAGKSNSIGNATGALASTTRDTAWMSYRGIENWYGNCWNWVDGFNINSNQGYIAADNNRAFYADDTATNYVQYGSSMINSNGYPTNILALNSGFLPSSVGGNSNTYLTDYYYQNSGWRVAIVGGSPIDGAVAGAFCWSLNYASSVVSRLLGARLVF